MSKQMLPADANSIGLQPFEKAYYDRLGHAVHSKAAGQKVIGFVGNTVPVELILAAGLVPCRLSPIDGDLSVSDRYVESFADPDVRRVFQMYSTGQLDMLDMLVIPRSSEAHHKLYLMLREANRMGLTSGKPPLFLYEILHTQRETSRLYGVQRTRELWQALLKLSVESVVEVESVNHAIGVMNSQRELLRQLHQLRWQQKISSTDALMASISIHFMPVIDGTQALAALVSQASPIQQFDLNFLIRGVPNDQINLHAALNHLNVNVLAEDDDWGARSGLFPIFEDVLNPIEKVFEHYWRDVPCGRKFPADDSWFLEHVKKPEVDGVVFFLPEPEDVYGWSYPADLKVCRQYGKEALLVRASSNDPESMISRLQSQLDEIRMVRKSALVATS